VKVSSKHLIAHEVNMLRRVAVCNGVCTLVWTGQVANHSALAVTPCGTPLPAYFKEWSSQELIDVATDVFRTLCSIHDLGVLHRDVKPDNIVIFKGKAVLCDFDAAVDTADVYAPVHATPLFTAPPEEMAERGAQWVDFAGLCYTMFLVEQGKSQPEWSSVPSIDNLAAQSSLVRHIVWLWDHVGEDSMTSSSL
jgi:serine/threonine protein kinase